jgi:hypothetical protein
LYYCQQNGSLENYIKKDDDCQKKSTQKVNEALHLKKHNEGIKQFESHSRNFNRINCIDDSILSVMSFAQEKGKGKK